MRELNVNHYVFVRLTDFGRQVERKNHEKLFAGYPPGLCPFSPKEEDPEGWSRWQLWDLMKEFGSVISMAGPVPFETTIRIDEAEA